MPVSRWAMSIPSQPQVHHCDSVGTCPRITGRRASARRFARDIFIDGNTFTDSHSVDREPFVADLQVGLALTFRALRIALTQVYRTPEFEERDRVQRFTALSLSMRW
jgi:hypothetical protein